MNYAKYKYSKNGLTAVINKDLKYFPAKTFRIHFS